MNKMKPKMLIEVALPVKEISAESVRDKSIRHGHISTMHLWWARRPLPVSRAVVFASLVPDPLDENCPQAFKDAVALLLGPLENGLDPYKPYDDIPYTVAIDPMQDNLRNRLLMFVGKFSDTFIKNEKLGKNTPAKEMLSAYSLIKWESKNNDEIINRARKLIWAAHNSLNDELEIMSYELLSADFDKYHRAIKDAEQMLYGIKDRHLPSKDVQQKEEILRQAIEAFLDKMPRVFDPFAGGGAIPLEAARLGCRTFANDLNPVAHIIEKGSLEFPQKFGKPILYSKEQFIGIYGQEAWEAVPQENLSYANGKPIGVHLENRLAFDVEFYAKKLLKLAEKEIGHFYPADKDGNKPVAYYWARVATCANPSCQAEVPLLKGFYLVNKKDKKIHLKPIINRKQIDFEIGTGSIDEDGWNYRGNLKCPCCHQTTDVKQIKVQSRAGLLKERLLAIIFESKNGKQYRLPKKQDIEFLDNLPDGIENFRPSESMQRNSAGGDTFTWGITRWGQMFSPRQLLALQTLVEKLQQIKEELRADARFANTQAPGGLNDYAIALVTYLGILVDRISIINTSFGRFNVARETLEHPFSRQAIPMIFDFPESNLFCNSTGSALNQLAWIIRYIETESENHFSSNCKNASSGDIEQFKSKYLSVVITDPPYYDAIAYADLSDFFYVWLKRTENDIYPNNLAFPQTPKSEECTALKHHHNSNADEAKIHFEKKLLNIFDSIEKQTAGIVSIMFAHQSTEAWTTLCNSILGAKMNITGSWAIDTEMGARMIALGNAALASSVTVACRPAQRSGFGQFKEIKKAIEVKVKQEVQALYLLGFRGADLLTACFGQAVSEFGKYERVEKADGTEVTVAELLELAREAAFNAIISDIDTDDYSKFYIGWLNLFGFSPAGHDDVRRITVIGLSIDVGQLSAHHIIVREGNKESLASCKQRIAASPKLGLTTDSLTIDKVHRAMALFSGTNRKELLEYIGLMAPTMESTVWRVLNSLLELLPKGTEEYQMASGLQANKESLMRQARQLEEGKTKQIEIGFE